MINRDLHQNSEYNESGVMQMTSDKKYYKGESGPGMIGEELVEQLRLMSFVYNDENSHIFDGIYNISEMEAVIKSNPDQNNYAIVKLEGKDSNHVVLVHRGSNQAGRIEIKIIDSLENNSKFVSQVEELANRLHKLDSVHSVKIIYQNNNHGECAAQTLIEILNGICKVKEQQFLEKASLTMQVAQKSNSVSEVLYFKEAIQNISTIAQTTGNITAGIQSLEEILHMIERAEYNIRNSTESFLTITDYEMGALNISLSTTSENIPTPKDRQRIKEIQFEEDKKKLIEAIRNNDVNVIHEVFSQHDQFYHEELMNVRNGERGIVLDNIIDMAERDGHYDAANALYNYLENVDLNLTPRSLPPELPIMMDYDITAVELVEPTTLIIGLASAFAANSYQFQ